MLLPLYLLFSRPAKYQHDCRKYIFGKLQKSPLFFVIFHNITDITRTNPKTFCRHHSILCCNGSIRHCKHQITHTWLSRFTASF